MSLVKGCIIAFSMYSKIPMPKTDWTKENMRYVMCFFPLVGLVNGLLLYGWFALAFYAGFGVLFRTAAAVLLAFLVTGGIHMDGFLDTCDALSSYKSREEKLEILKDPHAGAFAIICGACYFTAILGVYSELTMDRILLVCLGFVFSRSLSGLSVVSFPCAKNSGLAAAFSDGAQKRQVRIVMCIYLAVCTGLFLYLDLILGGLFVLTGLAVFGWYRSLSLRKFGGITGDLAGFFLQVCELLTALVVVVGGYIL